MSLPVVLAAGLFGASASATTPPPPQNPVASLTPTTAGAGDYTGNAVAISGATALIGAPLATAGTVAKAGVAYVESATTVSGVVHWTQSAKLVAPTPVADQFFGDAVAISGTTAVVGAPYAAGGGAAYVYTDGSNGWSETATLHDPMGTTGDDYGFAVAVSGSTVVVGSPGASTTPGTAYVYGAGATTPTASLADPAAVNGDSFGAALAITGSTIEVGAPQTLASNGAAYLFTNGTTGWTLTATFADPGGTNANFGSSVALASPTTTVVGAPGAYTVAVVNKKHTFVFTGGAYAFTYSATKQAWAKPVQLKEPATTITSAASGQFGSSVAYSGAVVVVGAPTLNGGKGGAFLFPKGAASAGSPVSLTEPAPVGATDEFGTAVGVSTTAALVGAPHAISTGEVEDYTP